MKKLILLAYLFLTVPSMAEIIIVDQEWPYDFNNIQAAVDYSNPGDYIFVFPGTYTGPGNRDIDFLGKAITVRSVFPDDPCVVAATVIDCNGSEAEPHRGFIFNSNEDANSVLEGLTIISSYPDGILCQNSGPVIIRCKIESTFIVDDRFGAWLPGYLGSGVYCGPDSSPKITDCSITECNPGIFCYAGTSPVITGCTIINEAHPDIDFGSGIKCWPNSNPQITDCLINGHLNGIYCQENNSVISGCTINSSECGIRCDVSTALITDCNITGYIADSIFVSRSGIRCTGGNFTITDCKISNYKGGGIFCIDADPVITDCTITGNNYSGIRCYDSNTVITGCIITDNTSGEGDVYRDGGGICCETGALKVDNCTIAGNSADNGGGIYCNESNSVITNCTITGNASTINGGGGIHCVDSNSIITGCTINDNIGSGIAAQLPTNSAAITGCTINGNSNRGIFGGRAGFVNSSIFDCIITANERGGITSFGGSIQNCTITDNSGEDSGSGISGCSGPVTNCTITGNGRGGGIRGCSGSIINCTISENFAESEGGGIYMCPGPITNCTITGNSAEGSGGGLYDCDGPITGCTISGNSAGNEGGGLYQCVGPVNDCIISYNSAIYGVGGGLSDCHGGITNCSIIGNYAEVGGGVTYSRAGKITNCSIIGNYAELYGGAVAFYDAPITNTTIADNVAGVSGGALYSYTGDITNSIIWDNIAPDGMPISPNLEFISVSFTDLQGGYQCGYDPPDPAAGIPDCWGLGNIDIDPCFVEPGFWADINDTNIILEPNDPNAVWVHGDYHLKSAGWRWDTQHGRWTYDDVTSRCIDAGNPGSPLADEPLTIPPDPCSEWGQNLRINMGAFGSTAQAAMPPYDWALLSDITNDGISDFNDLKILSSLWLDTGESLYADFNRDEIVDFLDFALLANDWLKYTSWNQ